MPYTDHLVFSYVNSDELPHINCFLFGSFLILWFSLAMDNFCVPMI